MSRCMEWLFIDRDGNWEWMSPAAWRISDIDQQISFYRGRQRFEAEVERAAVAAAPPAAAPSSPAQPKLQFGGTR